jgi:SAM-dependent methyltransferase
MEYKIRNCPSCCGTAYKIINKANRIDIGRCSNCSMVYAMLSHANIEENNHYQVDSFYGYLHNEPVFSLAYYDCVLDKIIKHFGHKELKILEFGCGAGFFLRRAKLKGLQCFGSDFSPIAQEAKRVFGLDIEVDSIFSTKYTMGSFDVVYTHATHEHLADMRGITLKLKDLLKVGGVLIISGVPNFNSILIKVFNCFYKNTPPSHVNFFEQKSIRHFLASIGLKPTYTKTYGMNSAMLYFYYKERWGKREKIKQIVDNEYERIYSEPKIETRHRIIAQVYSKCALPGMGFNIEAWATK